jgi:hypothetical protein
MKYFVSVLALFILLTLHANAEDNITIAYSTQKLNVSMQSESPSEQNHELV